MIPVYHIAVRQSLHHILPNSVADLDKSICHPFNRIGTLCGRCIEGLYPLLHTLDMNCVKCPDRAKSCMV